MTGYAYDAADAERRVDEGRGRGQGTASERSPFERDRARVLHSAALRSSPTRRRWSGPATATPPGPG